MTSLHPTKVLETVEALVNDINGFCRVQELGWTIDLDSIEDSSSKPMGSIMVPKNCLNMRFKCRHPDIWTWIDYAGTYDLWEHDFELSVQTFLSAINRRKEWIIQLNTDEIFAIGQIEKARSFYKYIQYPSKKLTRAYKLRWTL